MMGKQAPPAYSGHVAEVGLDYDLPDVRGHFVTPKRDQKMGRVRRLSVGVFAAIVLASTGLVISAIVTKLSTPEAFLGTLTGYRSFELGPPPRSQP